MSEAVAKCRANRDGDCDWKDCPQHRDGEPAKTGRHCPLDHWCPYCGYCETDDDHHQWCGVQ
jgi:hypothetical protein